MSQNLFCLTSDLIVRVSCASLDINGGVIIQKSEMFLDYGGDKGHSHMTLAALGSVFDQVIDARHTVVFYMCVLDLKMVALRWKIEHTSAATASFPNREK